MILNKKNKNYISKRKSRENREIMVILYIFLSLFISMIVYLAVFEYKDGNTIINSSYNKRLNILANHVYRGKILANDKSIIAQTVVDEEGNEKRVYPYGRIFAHSAGYSSYGGLGIEGMYAYTLLTSNDNILSRVTNDIAGQKNWGDSVLTTLDPYVSEAAFDALGDRKGAVVATNVKTGEILALISKPDFDPNTIVEYWDYYNNDSESSALLNRATQGLYPPGSTFKIVTALEYIRENADINDYEYNCSGTFALDGSVINCYHGQSHGKIDFNKSFAKSCNSSFANIASTLNKSKFKTTSENLMFNSELPIPYSYKKSVVEVNAKSKMEDVLQTGIGQGKTQITPMHMNLITVAIANNGVLMNPYVISKIVNIEGKIISENNPKIYGRLITSSESETLTELMESVVLEGTGTRLRDDVPYRAAGKTGSAEFSSDKSLSHAWFTGFAPVEDPEIAVTVIVENGGSGGETAVPIARNVMNAYFYNK